MIRSVGPKPGRTVRGRSNSAPTRNQPASVRRNHFAGTRTAHSAGSKTTQSAGARSAQQSRGSRAASAKITRAGVSADSTEIHQNNHSQNRSTGVVRNIRSAGSYAPRSGPARSGTVRSTGKADKEPWIPAGKAVDRREKPVETGPFCSVCDPSILNIG